MDTITVHIGTSRTLQSGQVDQDLTPVEFEAEELANVTTYHGDNDTRGTTKTLYRTPDGRLIVHIDDWSNWIQEPTQLHLVEIDEADLLPTGRYPKLGHKAGLSRPLSLDEALAG